MCDLDSASVVEDHGGFQSINTAAHELGHRYYHSPIVAKCACPYDHVSLHIISETPHPESHLYHIYKMVN